MRSHALRPRRMGVPKELVGGALVEENGGHVRLVEGVEDRLIKVQRGSRVLCAAREI